MTLSHPESYCEIPLTQGQVAIVDVHRFEELNKNKWYAHWRKDSQCFYAVRKIRADGRYFVIYMHRQVLHLKDKSLHADHINHNTLDNRECNLRPATYTQNRMNSRIGTRNKSGYKGVSWHKHANKFIASLRTDGKLIYLGLFVDPSEAAKAYDRKAKELFGIFAFLNFP